MRYPNPSTSVSALLQNTHSCYNDTMCSVQQKHQTGAHSIGDRAYRPVFASNSILCVMRNSFMSRVRHCLVRVLNTTLRVVVTWMGILEKRWYWSGWVIIFPVNHWWIQPFHTLRKKPSLTQYSLYLLRVPMIGIWFDRGRMWLCSIPSKRVSTAIQSKEEALKRIVTILSNYPCVIVAVPRHPLLIMCYSIVS